MLNTKEPAGMSAASFFERITIETKSGRDIGFFSKQRSCRNEAGLNPAIQPRLMHMAIPASALKPLWCNVASKPLIWRTLTSTTASKSPVKWLGI